MEDFKLVAVNFQNPNYNRLCSRESALYDDNSQIRSPFERDYTRILHSTAYRRLKHKTQVFFNVGGDHICTRMEHVLHVESVGYTIAKKLNLNEELVRAISTAHDLGHAPFGHHGERVIEKISIKYLGEKFWHERNGLYFADFIELLPNHDGEYQNLNLTYATRDGIISHCGEVDNASVKPRGEFIDLQNDFKKAGDYNAITYEGCVVKLADKIAYVGRDIEDAITLGFLSEKDVLDLKDIVNLKNGKDINTSTIVGEMIADICKNSSVKNGICFSLETAEKLKKIKAFNYKYIYASPRFEAFQKYSELIINTLFETLYNFYQKEDTLQKLKQDKIYPSLTKEFYSYLCKYVNLDCIPMQDRDAFKIYKNLKIYQSLQDEDIYVRAIIDYISGMTDRYAVECFNQLINF